MKERSRREKAQQTRRRAADAPARSPADPVRPGASSCRPPAWGSASTRTPSDPEHPPTGPGSWRPPAPSSTTSHRRPMPLPMPLQLDPDPAASGRPAGTGSEHAVRHRLDGRPRPSCRIGPDGRGPTHRGGGRAAAREGLDGGDSSHRYGGDRHDARLLRGGPAPVVRRRSRPALRCGSGAKTLGEGGRTPEPAPAPEGQATGQPRDVVAGMLPTCDVASALRA